MAGASGRRPAASIDAAGVACLVFAAVGWGLNWPLFKLLLREWPPLFARGTAGLVAAAALISYAAARREKLLPPPEARARLFWLAITNVYVFMGFSALALLWLSPGEGALLVYTSPLWVTLIAWPMREERPTWRTALSLALCFAGTLALFADSLATLDAAKLPGAALALATAAVFALGAVTAGDPLPMPPLVSTAWQILVGSALIVATSLVLERPALAPLSHFGLGAWCYMAAIPMGLCYLAWYAAIRRLTPSIAVTGSLLVPAVGVLASAPILGAPLGPTDLLALALVLSGVLLVLRRPAKAPVL